MNQNGILCEKMNWYRRFYFFRIIPNVIKNATSDLSKSVLASLVFLKEDQPDEDSR